MKRPDSRVLQALASLQSDPRYKIVTEWFEESREEKIEILESAPDDAVMRRAQGSSSELKEILRVSREARDILEKQRG